MQYGITRACQIIIGGDTYSSNCSSFKLDSFHIRRQQQTKELLNQIVNKPEHGLHYCYLLQENSLSLIVSDLPTNCRAYLQRPTDTKTLLFVTLSTVYRVNDAWNYLSDCVTQPSSCRITINWLIGWLIDWLIDCCYLPPDRGDSPAFTQPKLVLD